MRTLSCGVWRWCGVGLTVSAGRGSWPTLAWGTQGAGRARQMRLIASVLWLVELAACASEPARAPTPRAASQPPPVVAPGTLPSGRSEFDQQLDTLAAGPPRDAPGLTSSSAPAPVPVPADGSTRSNISTITPYLP